MHNRVLVWKPEVKRPLGTPRCRCEDNIKTYVKNNNVSEVGKFRI
jgi:hypothetical protein